MDHRAQTVLNHEQVEAKIKRIAWQLFEEFHQESKIILAGIAPKGKQLVRLLEAYLNEFSDLDIQTCEIRLNKQDIKRNIDAIEPDNLNFDHSNIVVVDDVLNSGATLMYGVNHFLQFEVQSIKTVVLVDRSHKRYPIKADFKGISLSTSLKEHVEVQIQDTPFEVKVY